MKTQPQSMIEQVKRAIRQPYAWPGGYRLVIWMEDGEMILPSTAKQNFREVIDGNKPDAYPHDTWGVAGIDVYWEGPTEYDAHTGEPIESEYGDPNSVE